MTKISNLGDDFRNIGIYPGDTVLLRAGLKNVGRVSRNQFLNCLLQAIGPDGTIMSLSFTESAFFWRTSHLEPFTLKTPSYAGALPNAMLEHPAALRSRHPQCSFVAIGRHAKVLTQDHGPESGAYEPVRRLMELDGKVALIGCVSSSPGFTTAHLAEKDLGMQKKFIFPSLVGVTPYINERNEKKIFHRYDPGLCSNSYWKFYAHYVNHALLSTGYVGDAYSILANAKKCYELEKDILSKNPKFNICDDPMCVTCNFLRWDRLHKAPGLLSRKIYKKYFNK